jgi:O-antigen ligase
MNMEYLSGWNRFEKLENVMAGLDNNSFCIGVVTGAGVAFFLGLLEKSIWRKWLCYVAAALMAHVTMFGESRGGMLGLVVSGIATFFLISKEPRHYYAFLLALIVGLRLAGPAVTARFMSSFVSKEQRDASAESRIILWEACWDIMKSNPLFGVGPDNFPIVVPAYGFNRGKEAHSLWFQTGAEVGFPGMFMLLGFYAYPMWRLFLIQRRKDIEDPWLIDASRLVIASFSGFIVSATFVSLEGLEFPYYLGLFAAGVLKVEGLERDARNERLKALDAESNVLSGSPHVDNQYAAPAVGAEPITRGS